MQIHKTFSGDVVKITTSPEPNLSGELLSFVRSGYVALNLGYIYNVGFNSYNWSRGAYSDTSHTHTFVFDNDSVVSSNLNARYGGFSLRCLQE